MTQDQRAEFEAQNLPTPPLPAELVDVEAHARAYARAAIEHYRAAFEAQIELPARPEPDAPANTVGLPWDAYSGFQMLAYGRKCANAAWTAAIEHDRKSRGEPDDRSDWCRLNGCSHKNAGSPVWETQPAESVGDDGVECLEYGGTGDGGLGEDICSKCAGTGSAPQPAEPCDMGDMCIGCTPRNQDGSCPDAAPAEPVKGPSDETARIVGVIADKTDDLHTPDELAGDPYLVAKLWRQKHNLREPTAFESAWTSRPWGLGDQPDKERARYWWRAGSALAQPAASDSTQQDAPCDHSEHVRPADGVCVECGEIVEQPAASVPDVIYLGCARLGVAGATNEEVLNYVRTVARRLSQPADDQAQEGADVLVRALGWQDTSDHLDAERWRKARGLRASWWRESLNRMQREGATLEALVDAYEPRRLP